MVRPYTLLILVLVGWAASSALLAQDAAPVAAATPVALAVPGRSNSTPWIAAQGRFVAVTWAATAAGKSDIFVAVSDDEGRTFSRPRQVNTVAGEARVNGEIPPRAAVHARPGAVLPEVVVAWNAKDQGTEITVARSTDFGKTFGAPVSLQAAGAVGERGWHSLTLDDQGVAHVLWLDHRGLAAPKEQHAHAAAAGEHDGVAMAQKSSLYCASFGARASAERVLTPGVCYCCKSAVAVLPGGMLVPAWRHVDADNMRDMAFTVSKDGGRSFAPPARVSQDGWSINGCPDDGPALAGGPDQGVHIVWPTAIPGAEPVGALFYAAMRADGSFTARTRIPTMGSPKPSHPQVVVDPTGRLVAAWDESMASVRTAAYSVGTRQRDGAVHFGPPRRLAASGPTTYPVMAAHAHGLVAAWTSGAPGDSVIAVSQLVAPAGSVSGRR